MKRMITGAAMALALTVPQTAILAAQEQAAPAATTPEAAPPQPVDAAAATVMPEVFTVLDVWFEAQRQYRKIPALSAAVVQGDQTVWARGFGTTDRAGKVPATPDTIYSICSISKLFTSIALMREWEQGKVRLDDPVTNYLPWAKLMPDDRDSLPVTLRGVLTHSAGIPREADFPYWTAPDFKFPTTQEVEAKIGQQAPLYPALREYQYSNLGLTLAGDTVEAVSGVPYADYVRRNVIEPLGLKDTRPGIPTSLYGSRMPAGWGARGRTGERPPIKLFDPAGITPAAGFTSTANDLARFASWHFRLLRDEKPEVLRASTLREMTRVQFVSPDRRVSRGLGYGIYEQGPITLVGHSGDCPGYRSTLMMDFDRQLAVTVLMNAMDDPQAFGSAVGALIGKRMEAKSFIAEGAAPTDLTEFTGLYDYQPWTPELAIVPWAGGLAVIGTEDGRPADDIDRLKHVEGDRFVVVDDRGKEREPVVFQRDAKGHVSAVLWHSNTAPRRKSL